VNEETVPADELRVAKDELAEMPPPTEEEAGT
jgi:hypothetical protein